MSKGGHKPMEWIMLEVKGQLYKHKTHMLAECKEDTKRGQQLVLE